MLNPALLVSGGHLREEKKRRQMQLFLQWTALYERCFFCPWQHTRHLQVSFISRVYVRASPPPALSPAHNSSGYRAASRWLCGEPGKYRPSMANISPLCLHGNIWPSQAVRAPPSACLTVSLHTLCWCILVLSWLHSFYSYTGTGLLYKQSTISTIPKQTG